MFFICKIFGRSILLATILISPWLQGGLEFAVQKYLFIGTTASCFFALIALSSRNFIERRHSRLFELSLIPLFLAVLLGCFQIVPLSDSLLKRASPRKLELRDLLSSEDFVRSPTETDSFSEKGRISEFQTFDSGATETKTDESQTSEIGVQTAEYSADSFEISSVLALDVALENELLVPDDLSKIPNWRRTISVYPAATRENLSLLIFATTAFFAAGVLFDSPRSQRFFWRAIAANGGIFALYCVATRANPAWLSFYSGEFDYHFGSYFNKNNAAGYLALCLGTAFFFLAERFVSTRFQNDRRRSDSARRFENRRRTNRVWFDGASRSSRRFEFDDSERRRLAFPWRFKRDFAENLISGVRETATFFRRSFGWIVVCGVIFAAVLASLSRGGTLAVVFGCGTGLVCLSFRRSFRSGIVWAFFFVVVAAIFVGGTGLREAVKDRTATLVRFDSEDRNAVFDDGRLTLWEGAIQTIRDYRGLGSGLGTFDIANRTNDSFLDRGLIGYYAENQWLETFVVAGYPGFLLLIVEFSLLLGAAIVCLKRRCSNAKFALGVGAIVLLTTQGIAAIFDFGLYLPANFLTLSVLCGSFASVVPELETNFERRGESSSESFQFWRRDGLRRIPLAIFGIGAFAFCCLGVREVEALAKIRSATTETTRTIQDFPWTLPPELVDDWIANLESLTEIRGDDYQTRLLLTDLWELRFRLACFERRTDEFKKISDEEFWARTSPSFWNRAIGEKQRIGLSVFADVVRNDPAVRQYLTQAARETLLARRICPMDPRVHLRLAVYLPLIFEASQENQIDLLKLYLRRAVAVSGRESSLFFDCGVLSASLGDYSTASRYWNQTLSLAPRRLTDVLTTIEAIVPPKRRDETLKNVLGDSFVLTADALKRYPKKTSPLVHDELVRLWGDSLRAIPPSERNAVYFFYFARWNLENGDEEAAKEAFQTAVRLGPREAVFYEEFGRFLFDRRQESSNADLCREIWRTYLILTPDAPRRREIEQKLKTIDD